MTGNEMIEYLSKLPAETLEQEILFEVVLAASPELTHSGHVPVIKAQVLDADRLLTPDGLVDPETAMQTYLEYQADVATGEITEEEAESYMPFNCPKILSEGQVLMNLQGLMAYKEEDIPKTTPEQILKISYWGKEGES